MRYDPERSYDRIQKFPKRRWREFLRILVCLALMLPAACAYAQHGGLDSAPSLLPEGTDPSFFAVQGLPANQEPVGQQRTSGDVTKSNQSGANPTTQATPSPEKQPRRILGVMPNYRAVSAGEIPPPPTPKQSFLIATENSFDYSSFVLVGLTSAMAEGRNAHPQLGKGLPGFGRYYWRGFLDKADGNYLVIFALPTIFHQDERYFAMGKGGIWKRFTYSASRIVITRDYHGHKRFNVSELLGRGIAQGISTTYHPSKARTVGALATKYGYALGRDALTNVFREFWPDIAAHVLHRHP